VWTRVGGGRTKTPAGICGRPFHVKHGRQHRRRGRAQALRPRWASIEYDPRRLGAGPSCLLRSHSLLSTGRKLRFHYQIIGL
jgi:hypothetical protein